MITLVPHKPDVFILQCSVPHVLVGLMQSMSGYTVDKVGQLWLFSIKLTTVYINLLGTASKTQIRSVWHKSCYLGTAYPEAVV